MNNKTIQKAIKQAGGMKTVGAACGVTWQSVQKWIKNGFPRTEWTGETSYAEIFSSRTEGKYSVNDLLVPRKQSISQKTTKVKPD